MKKAPTKNTVEKPEPKQGKLGDKVEIRVKSPGVISARGKKIDFNKQLVKKPKAKTTDSQTWDRLLSNPDTHDVLEEMVAEAKKEISEGSYYNRGFG